MRRVALERGGPAVAQEAVERHAAAACTRCSTSSQARLTRSSVSSWPARRRRGAGGRGAAARLAASGGGSGSGARRRPAASGGGGAAPPRLRRRLGGGFGGVAGSRRAAASRRGGAGAARRAVTGSAPAPASRRRRRSSRAASEWSSSGRVTLTSASSSCSRGSSPSRISRWACAERLDEEHDLARRDLRRRAAAARGTARRPARPSGRACAASPRRSAAVLQVLQQEQLAQVAQQVADELRVVGALVGEALHELERLGRAALGDDVGDLEEQVGAGDAERLEHVGGA